MPDVAVPEGEEGIGVPRRGPDHRERIGYRESKSQPLGPSRDIESGIEPLRVLHQKGVARGVGGRLEAGELDRTAERHAILHRRDAEAVVARDHGQAPLDPGVGDGDADAVATLGIERHAEPITRASDLDQAPAAATTASAGYAAVTVRTARTP